MKAYILENVTNMHVGSGDINFGVVDNLVQKDPVTNLPVIHSSSLKGSFREYFEEVLKDDDAIEYIFGQENSSSSKQPGAYTFFEAKLLTRPVRSNVELFFNATSPAVIREFLENCTIFGINVPEREKLEKLSTTDIKKITVFGNFDKVYIEDEEAEVVKDNFSSSLLGKNIVLYPDEEFKDLSLPFIARNKISKEGTSENLWYEEVVPKYSKFYFFINPPVNRDDNVKKFDDVFEKIDLIQFGANKSIGYGYCILKEIK